MNKFRIGGIIAATLIITKYLTEVDYNNLNWSTNETSYVIVICMLIFILTMVLAMKGKGKEKNKA